MESNNLQTTQPSNTKDVLTSQCRYTQYSSDIDEWNDIDYKEQIPHDASNTESNYTLGTETNRVEESSIKDTSTSQRRYTQYSFDIDEWNDIDSEDQIPFDPSDTESDCTSDTESDHPSSSYTDVDTDANTKPNRGGRRRGRPKRWDER